MGLEEISFTVADTQEPIYDPVTLTTSQAFSFVVNNLGSSTFTDLGIFIVPTTTIGTVDQPADKPPESDYQDLMTWGEQTVTEVAVAGGLILTVPQNDAPDIVAYVTRQQGSTLANMIPMKDLQPNGSVNITAELETPPGVTARRLFIGLRIDQSL